jgi:peroxiredoxin Q/BCP
MALLQIGDDVSEVLKKAGVGDAIGKRNVVLYFYPRDFTSGCTREAQDFRDMKPKFDEANLEIVGVSTDSEDSHKRFTERYKLTFALLSDPKGELARQCGAKGLLAANRTTYLIDRTGKVRFVWPRVSVGGHAEDVLAKAKELGL